MAKLIHEIVESCDQCPYCIHDGFFPERRSGYYCEHSQGSSEPIIEDSQFPPLKRGEYASDRTVPIPDWCPLDDAPAETVKG